ncbi:hypothetical protein IFM89_005697 [Coptis chinensis]|uniref:Uncharacterized protein n=1 Tax=Coptis chinensis TaxID=261450 RepID=A0A835H1W6_9MAGN|nr:hypothetical protein IFM89_005697 [Coptis chinensis]
MDPEENFNLNTEVDETLDSNMDPEENFNSNTEVDETPDSNMEENVTQRTGEKRKGRGAVVCSCLTKMKENESVDVVFNQNGQRIGEGGKDLASYSGLLATSRVSIATYDNWHDVKGEAKQIMEIYKGFLSNERAEKEGACGFYNNKGITGLRASGTIRLARRPEATLSIVAKHQRTEQAELKSGESCPGYNALQGTGFSIYKPRNNGNYRCRRVDKMPDFELNLPLSRRGAERTDRYGWGNQEASTRTSRSIRLRLLVEPPVHIDIDRGRGYAYTGYVGKMAPEFIRERMFSSSRPCSQSDD